MFFEDKKGQLLTLEQVNNLMSWELDEKRIHSYKKNNFNERKFIQNDPLHVLLNEQEYSPYYDILDEHV